MYRPTNQALTGIILLQQLKEMVYLLVFFIGLDYFYLCTSNMRLSSANWYKVLGSSCWKWFCSLFHFSFNENHTCFRHTRNNGKKNKTRQSYISLLYFYELTNELIHMPLFLFMLLMSFSSYIIFLVLHFRNSLLLLLNTWLQVICTLSVLQPSALCGKKYHFSLTLSCLQVSWCLFTEMIYIRTCRSSIKPVSK